MKSVDPLITVMHDLILMYVTVSEKNHLQVIPIAKSGGRVPITKSGGRVHLYFSIHVTCSTSTLAVFQLFRGNLFVFCFILVCEMISKKKYYTMLN